MCKEDACEASTEKVQGLLHDQRKDNVDEPYECNSWSSLRQELVSWCEFKNTPAESESRVLNWFKVTDHNGEGMHG